MEKLFTVLVLYNKHKSIQKIQEYNQITTLHEFKITKEKFLDALGHCGLLTMILNAARFYLQILIMNIVFKTSTKSTFINLLFEFGPNNF